MLDELRQRRSGVLVIRGEPGRPIDLSRIAIGRL